MTRGIVITGTHSGCGKTTISLGLMGALSKKYRVVPFKIGPDFVDPTYHRLVTGNFSYNLDLHMQGEKKLKRLYSTKSILGDIAIVEGVMGLFDGGDETGWGSSAHIAKLLDLPVILVVDGKAMSKSVSAVVLGYQKLDPELNLVGVILNRVGSQEHFKLLKKCIHQDTGLKVLGYLPQNPDLVIPERALGLIPHNELEDLNGKLEKLYDYIHTHIDIDEIIKIAKNEETVYDEDNSSSLSKKNKIKIALAQDKAFCFYYQAGLELFEEKGVTFIPFSPIQDASLPKGVSGLYIGGGFPEKFADLLSKNKPMMNSISKAINSGLPTYAEGGGLMYLMKSIQDLKGNLNPMVGIFDGTSVMTKQLQNFGYVSVKTLKNNILAPKGKIFNGQEFHYSKIDGSSADLSYIVTKPGLTNSWQCGYIYKNCLATYVHIDFYAYPELIDSFLEKCLMWKGEIDNG